MSYPSQFTPLANKEALKKHYVGKSINDLPTPSFIVNRDVFQSNCEKMLHNASKLKADFRAHIKTHKTIEGTDLQLGSGDLHTKKIVVSTLMEAWGILPLVKEGKIDDILFSLPVVESRLSELSDLASQVPQLRIMLDNCEQLDTLKEFNKANPHAKKWSVFIKINMGTDRAGLINDTQFLEDTVSKALNDEEIKKHVEIYGFYCHAGHSYSSDSEYKAKDFLIEEITHANKAAALAKKIDNSLKLQISVGATPTAHASEILTFEEISQKVGTLSGNLELHAGNYPFCDLQQLSTGCITSKDISIKLIADVISSYPGRGKKAPGEMLVNAGVVALAREFGPLPGHGRISNAGYENWIVARLSQEHGILTPLDEKVDTPFIPIGTRVSIIPQHSCITAAAHPFFFVVDNNDIVIDMWVPFRGW